MAKVYVSYSRFDHMEVGQIVAFLTENGHEVRWDGMIFVSDWWASTLYYIDSCELFIFVVSPSSLRSDYCRTELEYAKKKERPILALILQEPSNLHIPFSLPDRSEWLFYDGEPSRILSKVDHNSVDLDTKRDTTDPTVT